MYQLIYPLNKQDYESFSQNYPYTSLLQSYDWASIKNNWEALHFGIQDQNHLVGVCLVLIRPLPLGLSFAYCPHGPLMDLKNKELMAFFKKSLKQILHKKGCLFVRIDPRVAYRTYQADGQPNPETDQEIIDTLTKVGFIHRGFSMGMHDGFQPRFIANSRLQDPNLLPLSKTVQSYLRKAQRKKLRIERGQKDLLDDFVQVLSYTEKRQNITLRNKAYFKKLLDTYPDKAHISLAVIHPKEDILAFEQEAKDLQDQIDQTSTKKIHGLKDQLLGVQTTTKALTPYRTLDRLAISGVLYIDYGNTREMLYGGTNTDFSSFYPYVGVYHDIFQDAIQKKLENFHMGGVEGSLKDGLALFKARFNPNFWELPGEFDLATSPLYPLFNLAWWLRKKIKK